jgi:hypothetical protein
LFGDFSLIDQGFQGVYHGIAKCFGQVMVCELVTLADWRVLGELLEIMGASRSAWCTRLETYHFGDGEQVLLVST